MTTTNAITEKKGLNLTKFQDAFYFIRSFLTHPIQTGSLLPSSTYLTQLMMQDLPWEKLSVIVELGAGTGAFTEYIARHKKESAIVLVIEKDRSLLAKLIRRYGHDSHFIFGEDANLLTNYLNQAHLHGANCIICGLPFANFDDSQCYQLGAEIKNALTDKGILRAFQYTLHMKHIFDQYLIKKDIQHTYKNLPPAFVYNYIAKH